MKENCPALPEQPGGIRRVPAMRLPVLRRAGRAASALATGVFLAVFPPGGRAAPPDRTDPVPARGPAAQVVDSRDFVLTVVATADGKTLALGVASTPGRGRLAAARYMPDGSLDPSFGT